MNKRIPVKKNYFSFLLDLSASRAVRIGLFLTAGVVVILLCWFVLIRIEMDASTVFGVFALVSIPLIFLAIVFIGLEKITGISCLRGVEWVGKNTLLFFEWIMIKAQKLRGIEPKTSKYRVAQPDVTLSRSNPVKSKTAGGETDKTYIAESVLDFESIDAEDLLLDPLEYKRKIFSEAPGSDLEPTVNVSVEKPIIEENDKAYSSPSTTSLSDPIDEHSFFEPDTVELIDERYDIAKEDVLRAVVPELEVDDVEFEIKSLFQEEQDWVADEIVTESDNSRPLEEADLEQPELSFNIKSLVAEAENRAFDSGNAEHAENNMSNVPPEATEVGINQKTNAIDSADSALKDTEHNLSHPSMLFQAEQTAANILSSFSERFSRSSEKLSMSLGFHVESEYHLPSIDLLQTHQRSVKSYSADKLEEMSRSVERVLKDYKVLAEVVGAYPGPIITRFELSLAPGVKVSRVSGLAKDLARAMLVTSVRVVEIIEGTPYIGLEIPNKEREMVSFREIISSEKFQQAVSPLTFALGKDVSGEAVVSDLAKMPHLLVAGTTGSGKSVAINTMILSMLYKATPEQVRMIMVDPKMLELSVYEGIPHLLTPVVTDMKEAQNALRWAVAEMERRYKLMSKVGVRNLAGFNQKIEDAAARGETIRDPLFQLIDPLEEGATFPVLSTLPSIVIVIDELADMMMIVGKKVEELIARLAQKARAAGIHLVLATQRPSVDVLTGLIKANVPTRISFQVSSRIDSRTILDQGGAEALLGNGDMLFLPSGTSVPTRSHGAFVDDDEVHAVVDYLKTQGATNYLTEITQEALAENTSNTEVVQDEVDDLYDDAVSFVMETGRASISSVQRRFKVGYNRAARMIDQMEEENIVSEPEGNGSRRVLNREE